MIWEFQLSPVRSIKHDMNDDYGPFSLLSTSSKSRKLSRREEHVGEFCLYCENISLSYYFIAFSFSFFYSFPFGVIGERERILNGHELEWMNGWLGWDGIVGVYEMAAVEVRNMEIEDISSFDTNGP